MNSYVSVREVIDKLLTIKSYQKEFSYLDTLTWLAGAMQSIKGGVQVMDACCLMEVKDYTASYPKGYIRIRNIYHDGKLLERKQFRGNNVVIPGERYDSNKIPTLLNAKSSYFDELMKQLDVKGKIATEIYDIPREELIEKVDTNINYLIGVLREQDVKLSVEWFDDNPHCVMFSFEQGWVIYDYKTYVVDEEGLPLVYNNHEYKECLFYYCLYMHYLSIEEFAKSREMKFEYEKYLARAINQIKRMTDKQMDDFSDNWTNLLFNLDNKPFYQN